METESDLMIEIGRRKLLKRFFLLPQPTSQTEHKLAFEKYFTTRTKILAPLFLSFYHFHFLTVNL